MKRVKRVKNPRISWWLASAPWLARSSHHIADTFISPSTDCPSVLHPIFCSFRLFYMFVVQVCGPLGHCADHRWDGYGHNHWGNVSHQFHCVWKADRHFYTKLQDVPPKHQRLQSVFTCRCLHEHPKRMCVMFVLFLAAGCFLWFQISPRSEITLYKTKCMGKAEISSLSTD